MGGPGLRFLLEAAFLIVLAVAAGLAELSTTTIVLVMAAAWLLVASIEWLAWRERPLVARTVREEPPRAAEPRRRFWRRRRRAEEPVEVEEPTQAPDPGEDTQDLEAPAEEPAPVAADERTGT